MRIVRYTYPSYRGIPQSSFGGLSRSPWTGLESEIDRLFATALTGTGEGPSANEFPVDLYEDKHNTYVRAELPGLAREAINVEMVEGYLTISGSRKIKEDENEQSFSFSRSVNVPEETQSENVSAAFENGILTVTLPKREETKPKKVSVAVK